MNNVLACIQWRGYADKAVKIVADGRYRNEFLHDEAKEKSTGRILFW